MLQILHPLLTWNLMPVSKAGYERIVEHDELGPPSSQLYGLHVLLQVWGSEALFPTIPFQAGIVSLSIYKVSLRRLLWTARHH
jgi:hypothetical protein